MIQSKDKSYHYPPHHCRGLSWPNWLENKTYLYSSLLSILWTMPYSTWSFPHQIPVSSTLNLYKGRCMSTKVEVTKRHPSSSFNSKTFKPSKNYPNTNTSTHHILLRLLRKRCTTTRPVHPIPVLGIPIFNPLPRKHVDCLVNLVALCIAKDKEVKEWWVSMIAWMHWWKEGEDSRPMQQEQDKLGSNSPNAAQPFDHEHLHR